MSTLVENEGLVSLYRGEDDSIIVEINGREVTLQQPFKFAYNTFWSPVAADLFNDPNSDNDNNILTLWNNIQVEPNQFGDYRWQVASFSIENGKWVGMYNVGGTFLPGDKFLEQPNETLYLAVSYTHLTLPTIVSV